MLIVTRMRRLALIIVLTLLFVPAAWAQSSAVGISIGSGESLKDGLDFSFGDTVYQLYYETSFGGGTSFRVQYGTFDTTAMIPTIEGELIPENSSIEFIDLIGRYEFDEVYGQSSVFGGLGLYRNETATLDDEKDWGLVLGVDGTFPVSRRFALTAEIAYHWADFEQNLSVIVVSGGVKIRF